MADAPPTPPADNPAPPNNRKRKAIGVFLVVFAATVLSGLAYWKYRQTHVSTDDAYIDGRIHLVSARVQGTVVEVRVRDNQPVRAGDPLLRIDPEPFAVRESGAASAVAAGAGDVEAARADLVAARSDVTAAIKDLEGAKAQLAQLSAGIESARARTSLAAARRSQASRDAARMKQLYDRQVISRESFEKAQTDAEVAKAQDDVAKEELRLAEAALPTQEAIIAQKGAVISQRQSVATQREARIRQLEAQVEQRKSALAEAKLLHRYTTVLSPGGRVRHPEKRRGGPGRFPRPVAPGRGGPGQRVGGGELQGNGHRADPPGAGSRDPRGHVQGKEIQGIGRQHHGGDRLRLRPLSAGERLGELREGRTARPGEDRPFARGGSGPHPADRNVRRPHRPGPLTDAR